MDDIIEVLEELVDRLDWDDYDEDVVRVRAHSEEGWAFLEVEGPVAELLKQIKDWLQDQ